MNYIKIRPLLKIFLIVTMALSFISSIQAAPENKNLFSNSSFELPAMTSDGKLTNLPKNWTAYDWGFGVDSITVSRQAKAGKDGNTAVLIHNKTVKAKAGIYTHLPLEDGEYEFSVWAKAKAGESAKVRLYFANVYSPVFTINDQWIQLKMTNSSVTVEEAAVGFYGVSPKGAEVSIQNVSERVGTVFLSDVKLKGVNVGYHIVPDTRPDRPRTILNSQINVNYLRDTADVWAQRGFRGFNLLGIMRSHRDNPWETADGTIIEGEKNPMLQAVRECNNVCRNVGIDSNFVKIGLYDSIPDPFDDAAWKTITENFRQGARFARLSGSVGISLDTEYVAKQYRPTWDGYVKNGYALPNLKAKFYQRWNQITLAMLEEYPEMVLTILPDGVMMYGELYHDLFSGIVSAMAEKQAPGGVHVFTETSYHMLNISTLGIYSQGVQQKIQEILPIEVLSYWEKNCSIALGAWPLGYYRPLMKDGKRIGYSGRPEIFGDKNVGSYADKSAWYSPEAFRDQMTGLNTYSPRYNWIYAHGDVFWQWTEKQKEHYEGMTSNRIHNVLVPTAPNVDKYLDVLQNPQFVKNSPENIIN